MTGTKVDAKLPSLIARLGERILNGGPISREEALSLFHLESSADIFDLLSWANRIREQFKGNKIHLCSIVNAKAGACSGELQFLRAIRVLPDRLAQVRLRGSRTGAGRRRGSRTERRHRRRPRRRVERTERRPDARRGLRPRPRIEGQRQDPSRRLAGHHQEPARRRPAQGSRRGMLRPQPRKLAPLFPADLHHAHLRGPPAKPSAI